MTQIPEIVCALDSVKVKGNVRASKWRDDVSPERILNCISVACGDREGWARAWAIHSTFKKSGRMQEHPTLRLRKN